jgi:drug/metabolite transporter (DMT)-like permease
MESINKLENTIAGWLKPLPHLPTTWQKWIAENVWWITVIGVILSVIGVVALIGSLSFLSFVTSSSYYYGYYVAQSHTSLWMISSVVSILFMIVSIVLMAMAINPLKLMKKKGWGLLFLTFVVGALSTIVSIILNFNVFTFIPSIIFGAIGLAISAYFLYEIRSYFNGVKVAAPVK